MKSALLDLIVSKEILQQERHVSNFLPLRFKHRYEALDLRIFLDSEVEILGRSRSSIAYD